MPEPSAKEIALAFLDKVLPSEGIRFAALKMRTDRMRRVPFETNEQLIDASFSHDSDAYFSAATFKDKLNSTGGNIKALKCFRMDIDCGSTDKHYETQRQAAKAVLTFVEQINIPKPFFVNSGYGLHVYWSLKTPIDKVTWEKIADALKRLTQKYGLNNDLKVIIDCARILRLPGTYNHKDKNNLKEVKIEPDFTKKCDYELGQFDHVFDLISDSVSKEPQVYTIDDLPLNDRNYSLIKSCLDILPVNEVDDRGTWFETGCSLYNLGWDAIAYNLWLDWSKKSSKFDEKDQIKTWMSLENYTGERRTYRSLILKAKEYGWTDTHAAEKEQELRGWEYYANGRLKNNSFPNTRLALRKLGITAKYDTLALDIKVYTPWFNTDQLPEEEVCAKLRKAIIESPLLQFDPTTKHLQDSIYELATDNKFNSFANYLDGLKWDGVPRLDRWLITYLHAENNEINRYFGPTFLIAAVRRGARDPTALNAKFDHMLLLEGEQSLGKSMVAQILGLGPQSKGGFYASADVSNKDSRIFAESIQGAVIIEWPDLKGMGSADANLLKARITLIEDKVRHVYRRKAVPIPRMCVFMGSTNKVGQQYLTDETGGRRFWPVLITQKIDINKLREDIPQLWAEASEREKTHGPFIIPEKLNPGITQMQKDRTEESPFIDFLQNVSGQMMEDSPFATTKTEFITFTDVAHRLEFIPSRMSPKDKSQIHRAMIALGWTPDNRRIGENKIMTRIFKREIPK